MSVSKLEIGERLPGAIEGGAVAGVKWTSTFYEPDDDIPSSSGRARPRYITQADFVVHYAAPIGA